MLLAQLSFLSTSSPDQCAGCDRQFVFYYDSSVTTKPLTQIVWWRDTTVIYNVQVQSGGILKPTTTDSRIDWKDSNPTSITIKDLKSSDSGTYKCQAFLDSGENIVGTTTFTVNPTGMLSQFFPNMVKQ